MRGETSSMTAGENSKIIPLTSQTGLSRQLASAAYFDNAHCVQHRRQPCIPIFDKGTLTASFVDEATAPDLGKGSFDTIKLESYIVTAQNSNFKEVALKQRHRCTALHYLAGS